MASTETPTSTGNTAIDDKPTSVLGNLLAGKTPAVSSIEAAYSRAGATNTHTPGVATALGQQGQLGDEAKGVGSKHFTDNFANQREEVCVYV